MDRVCLLFCCLLTLAAVAKEVYGEQSCTDEQHTLDCSYSNVSTIALHVHNWCETHRYSYPYTRKWVFRGNNLRAPPAVIPYCVYELDLSNTGLVKAMELREQPCEDCFIYDDGDHGLRVLDVSFNYLDSLRFYHDGRCLLTTLNVSNNFIANLETNSCSYLSHFRIANNKITELPSDIFSSWPHLSFLDVSGNPIASVSPDAFQALSELDSLRLDNTYQLSNLSEGTFVNQKSLRYLHLAGNIFTSLPVGVFESMSKLEVLELQRNRLRQLPDRIFENLVALRVLFLDDNELQHLSSCLFARLHSLEELSARGNRLATLPSLHKCSGPLRTAMFNDNQITKVSEIALRSFLRHGFRVGDLRDNPFSTKALEWTQNISDIQQKYVDDTRCNAIELNAKGHGMIFWDTSE